MRPCLNPGQMNPPGGTHSPAAWISPSQPYLPQTLQSSVCLLTHPYFSQCLPFTSPTKVHPSYALCHAVSPTSPTAFALTCGPSHMRMSYRLVTAVFKSFGEVQVKTQVNLQVLRAQGLKLIHDQVIACFCSNYSVKYRKNQVSIK